MRRDVMIGLKAASVASMMTMSAGFALAQPAAEPAKETTKEAAPAEKAALDLAKPVIKDIPVIRPGKDFTIEAYVSGVEVPWSIVWTSASRMLFTERTGKVRVVEGDKLSESPLYTVPDLIGKGGENGLMGLAVHPNYAANRFVYISYGTKEDVRVVRLKDIGEALVEPTPIVTGIPAGRNHVGCRLAFGPDGKLYIATGETFERELAQDMNSLGGKILRVNDDGTVPSDNPFVSKENTRGEIFSFGHRNPQGLAWTESGLMLETEHGPSGEVRPARGDDEFNIVQRGADLGWPKVWGSKTEEGTIAPTMVFSPAIAPASAAYYNAERFPQWKGSLFFGALGGLRPNGDPGVYRIALTGEKVTGIERMATGFGRIRCVAVGPDGAIYFSTSNKDGRAEPREGDDKIYRIVPAGT
ncbi:MAG TPA: PQQ-dependent sugar dehydrogenase [Phycisphaerales bacterium]|nr:PQQ-dependent sugar dehydrogenase [Phycisphaerales bacterium]